MHITELKSPKTAKTETLYVSRRVANAADILAWAKEQGFETTLDPSDLHVTVAYSKAKVNWDEIEKLDDPVEITGGKRSIEQFDGGAIVLKIESKELHDRWQELKDAGCSWDYPDYKPHITISYDGLGDLKIKDIEPYRGKIVLKAEVHKPVDLEWKDKVKKTTTENQDEEFEAAAHLLEGLIDEEMIDLPQAKLWFHPEGAKKIAWTDKPSDTVVQNWRRMRIERDHVHAVIQQDGDEDISTIEEEELCELAMGHGWVLVDGNIMTGHSVTDLRAAVDHFRGEWPGQPITLKRIDHWEVDLDPDGVDDFADQGILPDRLREQDTHRHPRRFWLVFDIPTNTHHNSHAEEVMRGLADGEMKGVKGISDNREIITSFFSVARNAALVMDSERVMKNNDIERIDYHDINYMLAGGMSALYRIWDKSKTPHGHHGLMQNIVQYVVRYLHEYDNSLAQTLSYYGFANKIAVVYQDRFADSAVPDPVISNLAALQDFIYDAMKEAVEKDPTWLRHLNKEFADIKQEDLSHAVKDALRHVGKIYADEGEWLVLNPVFKVPPQSVLLITADLAALAKLPEWKMLPKAAMSHPGFLHNWHYERLERILDWVERFQLDKRYTIRFIDEMKFSKVRSEVVARRNQSR